MARKTGKTTQTLRVFRQIVQTWRENQARADCAPARAARLARNPSTPSVYAQETRHPHEMDTGLKSLATCEPRG